MFVNPICSWAMMEGNFEEATMLSQGMSDYQKKLIVKKAEFLEISLFDLWTSNEDRNENNYNLMLDVSSGYRFTPIDHQHTFNSGRAGQELTLLTEGESLIGTTFFGQLFTRKDVRSHLSGVGAKNKFYLCVKRCFDDLEGVVSEIPDGWHSNKKQLLENLRQTIFQENWKQLVWNTFMEYLHVATN